MNGVKLWFAPFFAETEYELISVALSKFHEFFLKEILREQHFYPVIQCDSKPRICLTQTGSPHMIGLGC